MSIFENQGQVLMFLMMMRIIDVGAIASLSKKRLPQEKSGTRFSKIRYTPQTKKNKNGLISFKWDGFQRCQKKKKAMGSCGGNVGVANARNVT